MPTDADWTPISSREFVDAAHVVTTAGTPVLALRFLRTGNVYLYAGVPRYIFRGLISAPCAGDFLAAFVFGRFRCVASEAAPVLPNEGRHV